MQLPRRPEPDNKPAWWDAAMKRTRRMDAIDGASRPDIGAAWAALEAGLGTVLPSDKARECLEEAAILVFHEYINQHRK